MLSRWLGRVAEKMARRYYEGPDPPARLGEIVITFANLNPQATRAEWARFAEGHAREAYRVGYVRGAEYVERDPAEREALRNADPEQLADALNPDWRWSPGITLDNPDDVPSAGPLPEAERIAAQLRALRRPPT